MNIIDIRRIFKGTSVHFFPWIGDNYFSNKSSKILILGESHYGGSPEIVEQELTYTCVDQVQSETWRNSFFTRVKNICTPVDTNLRHQIFWNQVSYYNFVQQIVGNKARVRPTDTMWKDSKAAFLEVCLKIEPNIIVILGSELRTKMEMLNLISIEKPLFTSNGKRYYVGLAITQDNAKKTHYICITHPSSPRHFGKLEGWQKVVNDFLTSITTSKS